MLELQSKDCGGFYTPRFFVPHAASAYARNLVLQDVPHGVHAMDAHVSNRPAPGQRRIRQPRPSMLFALVRKFSTSEDRPPDLSTGDPFLEPCGAVLKPEDVCHAQ